MQHDDDRAWHGRAWTALLALAGLTELHALCFANPHGTFSHYARVHSGCTRSTMRRALLLGGLGWLAAHLLHESAVAICPHEACPICD